MTSKFPDRASIDYIKKDDWVIETPSVKITNTPEDNFIGEVIWAFYKFVDKPHQCWRRFVAIAKGLRKAGDIDDADLKAVEDMAILVVAGATPEKILKWAKFYYRHNKE